LARSSDILKSLCGPVQTDTHFYPSRSREGTQFFVQAIGRPKLEVFAESEREYFLKSVNAQITFEVDSDGRRIALTLHQNSKHRYGASID